MSAPKVLDVRAIIQTDPDPDTSYLDQKDFDDRRKQYRRGDFHFVGVFIEADVEVNGTVQRIASPGLWGIESDSGDKYLQSIAKEECDVLHDILKSMGVKNLPSCKSMNLKHRD